MFIGVTLIPLVGAFLHQIEAIEPVQCRGPAASLGPCTEIAGEHRLQGESVFLVATHGS